MQCEQINGIHAWNLVFKELFKFLTFMWIVQYGSKITLLTNKWKLRRFSYSLFKRECVIIMWSYEHQ